jgi:hypothetical protein
MVIFCSILPHHSRGASGPNYKMSLYRRYRIRVVSVTNSNVHRENLLQHEQKVCYNAEDTRLGHSKSLTGRSQSSERVENHDFSNMETLKSNLSQPDHSF